MQDESTEYHQFVFPLQAVPPSPLFVHYCMISPAVVVGLPWIGVVLVDPATHLVDLIFGVSSLVNLRGCSPQPHCLCPPPCSTAPCVIMPSLTTSLLALQLAIP